MVLSGNLSKREKWLKGKTVSSVEREHKTFCCKKIAIITEATVTISSIKEKTFKSGLKWRLAVCLINKYRDPAPIKAY